MKDLLAERKGHNPYLLEHARNLRREMTKQERRLWYDFLRDYPVKIYKQKIIDSYIVDFHCHSAKLVIELDGGQHYTDDGIEYDEARTSVLESLGLRVIRFTNHEVDNNFDEVCKVIMEEIKSTSLEKAPLRPFGAPPLKGEAFRVLPPLLGEVAAQPTERCRVATGGV